MTKLTDERLHEYLSWLGTITAYPGAQQAITAHITALQAELREAKDNINEMQLSGILLLERAETAEAALKAAQERERWIMLPSHLLPQEQPVYFAEKYNSGRIVVATGQYKPDNMDGYRWWDEDTQRFVAPEAVVAWMPRPLPAPPVAEPPQATCICGEPMTEHKEGI